MAETVCFVIDDDKDDLEIFAIALEDLEGNPRSVTASNGVEALEKLNSDTNLIPDFIFIDLNMPFMSGTECLKEIKKISRLRHVPVIMYTTSSYEKDIQTSQELGANHFLVKPPSISIFSDVLNRLLKKEKLGFHLTNYE